jgi:hypothetical protein
MTAAPFDWQSAQMGLLDASRAEEVLTELDAECLKDGRLQAMPAAFYAKWSQNDLSLWCVNRGFYCLPTLELVDFIRDQIDCENAIEIGAGNGALGRAVGIPMTDSRQQEREDVRELYIKKMGQAVVDYGDDVEKYTALEAAEKYRPRVILAAWVTHRFNPERPQSHGNMNGVDESKLLGKKYVKKYIFVGHERVHALKPILSRRHTAHRLPYLYSRSFDLQNVVWIWG